ncbi:double-strand break repair protein AddB [Hyphomicrobiales bacterium BP6-180914]|uniref:Double-strand break repair protein AddB n=1 Tax=Lichenifustis flavocetrariae TaxID=2949735 RepID=A0AA42CH36_9HYPH|nr:double-strand break repair protein AddB [Lichenifustis flavocetrariae]
MDGRLVPGFSRDLGPLGMVDATIYLPTRRSARALAATIASRIGTAAFLPRIRALGALDDDNGLFDDLALGEGLQVEIPKAIEPLARRMILTRLILRWSESVRHALVSVGPDGRRETQEHEAFLVATTAADAWHLSGELAALLDELTIEDVSWAAMKPLGTEAFDRYWAVTLDFLAIAIEQWPAILGSLGLIDPAARQARLIEAETLRLQRPGARSGPVIVVGSTGSNRATSRLMAAIACLPQGAVVLPGLDQYLDEPSWASIDGTRFDPGSAAGHAQAAIRRLLPVLGVERTHVVGLGEVAPALAARGRFVSEALRPADSTDVWHALGPDPSGADLGSALAGISIVEAADEREEALALALALREALEGPGSATLVTPDRSLARRVREELIRWDIVIDDSGGEQLGQTSAGALARLAIEAACGDMDPVAVLALLAHPAVCLGRSRATVTRLSRLLEMAVLRTTLDAGALLDPSTLMAKTRARASDPHAPRWLQAMDEDTFGAIENLLEDLLALLEPLRRARQSLPAWIDAHEEAVVALAATESEASGLRGPDANALMTLFEELSEAADGAITLEGGSYAALYDRMVSEVPVRGPERSHPRLKILGLLEARLLSSDRVLLGGLDETVWPTQVSADAFLNRPMRAVLGLTPPERRIGQDAHDFTMALGQPEVIISRAAKRGGSPTVPSRFLQRMAAVAGATHWDRCRARGRIYLDMARALDRPAQAITLARPCPRPPVELRPTALSVTRIETLRRDPYAIYADRILRLSALDPVAAPLGPREWGTLFHKVLSDFTAACPGGRLPANAEATLLEQTRVAFAPLLGDPGFQAFMAPRIEGWAKAFFLWEEKRRGEIATIAVEEKGAIDLKLRDGSAFTLRANADRLETTKTGLVRIIDFKTGRVPSKKEVQVGFAPQLTLEAALAEQGGFAALGPGAKVEEALYVGFGSSADLALTRLEWKDRSLPDVVEDHLTGLVALLSDFRDPATGYLARPYPQFQARYSDYDHLSRVKEWAAQGSDPGEGTEG